MSSLRNKRTFLCSQAGQVVYLTTNETNTRWAIKPVPATEQLIQPSLIIVRYLTILQAGDIVWQGKNKKETLYVIQNTESLNRQLMSLEKLISMAGGISWYKTAHLSGLEKLILMKIRTGELKISPEVEKLYSTFEKCVALTKSDKVGEQEAAYSKAVLLAKKLTK